MASARSSFNSSSRQSCLAMWLTSCTCSHLRLISSPEFSGNACVLLYLVYAVELRIDPASLKKSAVDVFIVFSFQNNKGGQSYKSGCPPFLLLLLVAYILPKTHFRLFLSASGSSESALRTIQGFSFIRASIFL